MNSNINDDEKLLKQYYNRYGGFWVYPDMLDYCYLVNPYFNRSKIIDEMESNFRTLVSEYPAGMNVNSMLASEWAHPTKSVAGPNQTPTIPDRKRTECPLPHAVGF